jgi:hypothetical protein
MALTKSGNAPYGPPSAVIEVIDRFRNRGLSVPIDLDVLQMTGVSESLAPRTLQALRLLDLITDDGYPTTEFQELREVPSDRYQDRLAAHIKQVYAEVLSFVDPASDPIERVEDAFRAFQPHGQRARMVTLFLGLCTEAGLIDRVDGRSTRPKTPARKTTASVPKPQGRGTPSSLAQTAMDLAVGGLPPAIIGLIGQLPSNGTSWTADRRDTFLKVLRVTLDYVYPIENGSS